MRDEWKQGVTFDDATPFATSFPQVISTAQSFNKTLFNSIGSTIGKEGRAFHNSGHAGLTFWAPNVNKKNIQTYSFTLLKNWNQKIKS